MAKTWENKLECGKGFPSALPQIKCLYRPVREGKVWGRCHGKCLHSKSAALFKSARRTSGDVGTGYYLVRVLPHWVRSNNDNQNQWTIETDENSDIR